MNDQPAHDTGGDSGISSRPRPVTLERHDLMRFEARLVAGIAALVPHQAHSLHFPDNEKERHAEYLGAERRLLLPLWTPRGDGETHGRLLGIYAASGVKAADVKPVMKALPALADLLMQNLLLYKRGLSDTVTGLFSREFLLEGAAREVDAVREAFSLASASSGDGKFTGDTFDSGDFGMENTAYRRPGMGIIAIRVHSLRAVVREHGYLFADRVMAAVGSALRECAPSGAIPARAGDFECALLLPGASAKLCRSVAQDIAAALLAVTVPHGFTRKGVGIAASMGFAVYPQDMPGPFFSRPATEQARLLLRNARQAAALAEEERGPDNPVPVMAFSRILARGGKIMETLPLSRVLISLGADAGAREGLRFSVWDAASHAESGDKTPFSSEYKGELTIIEVRKNAALAEIAHLGDPAKPISRGDKLILLPGETSGNSPFRSLRDKEGTPDNTAPRLDPLTGLLHHGDFLARWSAERENCETFALGLLRLAPHAARSPDEGGAEIEDGPESDSGPQLLMGEAVRLCREILGDSILGGRYGLTSLIFFHPDASPESVKGQYEELCRRLAERLFPGRSAVERENSVAAGISFHPFLSFRKADSLDNARKALEYGALLPFPHVGLLDSLALTISADKSFSFGDGFTAIEEYKRALLADNDNTLAWNSLGVCLASLGRHGEARQYFDQTLAREPENSMALYNLGYSCQCLGEIAEAKNHYNHCLERDPEHMFALLRLGQIAEAEGSAARAKKLFTKAAALPGGKVPALRHLAGLAYRGGKKQDARELLHEVLSLDPQNAVALHMLASLYLDGGEDAAVAESLARQSITLRPGLKSGWLVLARALEASGKSRDAREALLKAGEL